MERYVTNRIGLEIGGPSPIFGEGRLIPVYDRCRRIDNCNFSSQTIWGSIGGNDGFGLRLGKQIVAEACNLAGIADGTYDFLLASHVLEHTANPLRALQEWKRVLAPGGGILIVVPDKLHTFDHRRPFTSIEHIQADYRASVSEDDLTHLEEILALHDLSLDPAAGSPEDFRKRCMENLQIRGMHHHVFSPETVADMFGALGMRIVNLTVEKPFHVIAMAEKADAAVAGTRARAGGLRFE
jgi:SAM-dependent methyltransferase